MNASRCRDCGMVVIGSFGHLFVDGDESFCPLCGGPLESLNVPTDEEDN